MSPQFGKPPNHGRGFWYSRVDGSKVWLRSSYEKKYVEYLDKEGIEWQFESKGFKVNFIHEGEEKSGMYWPDFLIDGAWIEIKGWWQGFAKAKFEAFKEQYPEERISLLMKDDLLALGIQVK